MSVDKKLAKDVAKQLDRRRLRRKLLIWALVIGAIVAAILFLTCGRGWGLGGAGKGEGRGEAIGSAVPADAGPKRCAIRVTATGLTLDGVAANKDAIVAACTGAVADVVVTGDARQGDWEELKAALERANVTVFLKQR